MSTRLHGAWPALITPSTPEGGVDMSALGRLTEHLLGKAISGLYVCGATGEGLLMTVAERMQVTEAVLRQVNGKVAVIVHVGCPATRDAAALARHARSEGADGVSSLLPSLGDGLPSTILHYQAIAAALDGLPFYPYLYGAQTDAVSLMAQLKPRIPNLGGAKYTGPSMFDLKRLVDLGEGRWTVFSGMDEQCLYAAMSGAPANIGSTLNPMPGVYDQIRRCYEAGQLDAANELQIRVNRVTAILISFGFSGALREAMRLLGIDCGQPRLPLVPLAEERRAELASALSAAGFFELAAL